MLCEYRLSGKVESCTEYFKKKISFAYTDRVFS